MSNAVDNAIVVFKRRSKVYARLCLVLSALSIIATVLTLGPGPWQQLLVRSAETSSQLLGVSVATVFLSYLLASTMGFLVFGISAIVLMEDVQVEVPGRTYVADLIRHEISSTGTETIVQCTDGTQLRIDERLELCHGASLRSFLTFSALKGRFVRTRFLPMSAVV